MDPDLQSLRELIESRNTLVRDAGWRSRDPEGHLAALQSSYLAIQAKAEKLSNPPPHLHHYLENGSFEKALALLNETARSNPAQTDAAGS